MIELGKLLRYKLTKPCVFQHIWQKMSSFRNLLDVLTAFLWIRDFWFNWKNFPLQFNYSFGRWPIVLKWKNIKWMQLFTHKWKFHKCFIWLTKVHTVPHNDSLWGRGLFSHLISVIMANSQAPEQEQLFQAMNPYTIWLSQLMCPAGYTVRLLSRWSWSSQSRASSHTAFGCVYFMFWAKWFYLTCERRLFQHQLCVDRL